MKTILPQTARTPKLPKVVGGLMAMLATDRMQQDWGRRDVANNGHRPGLIYRLTPPTLPQHRGEERELSGLSASTL